MRRTRGSIGIGSEDEPKDLCSNHRGRPPPFLIPARAGGRGEPGGRAGHSIAGKVPQKCRITGIDLPERCRRPGQPRNYLRPPYTQAVSQEVST